MTTDQEVSDTVTPPTLTRRRRHLAAWVIALAVCAGLRPLTGEALAVPPTAAHAGVGLQPRAVATVTRCPKRKRRRRPRLTHVDGDIVGMRYGPVQARVYFCGRRIVDVRKLKHPEDIERSRQIGADSLPKLRRQVLAAQSARIDGVSGATYTSAAYKQSVQSALDLA